MFTYVHQQLMLSNTSNYVIARYITYKLDGYHRVKCISKRLGYRNTAMETRGCITAVPSLLREVRLRWRGVRATQGLLNATKAHPILR